MSTASAVRQQRALEDLLKQPGNDTCAECGARFPRWASVNLGIFICEKCAGLHRKLGVHISKVKSVSFDSWDKQALERMRSGGNLRSNAQYNPNNERPPTGDDSARAFEQFLRQKYEAKRFVAQTREDGDLLM